MNKYGFCRFPDYTVKFVKIIDSNKSQTKVQYPWPDNPLIFITTIWVHSSWVQPLNLWAVVKENEGNLLSSQLN